MLSLTNLYTWNKRYSCSFRAQDRLHPELSWKPEITLECFPLSNGHLTDHNEAPELNGEKDGLDALPDLLGTDRCPSSCMICPEVFFFKK